MSTKSEEFNLFLSVEIQRQLYCNVISFRDVGHSCDIGDYKTMTIKLYLIQIGNFFTALNLQLTNTSTSLFTSWTKKVKLELYVCSKNSDSEAPKDFGCNI